MIFVIAGTRDGRELAGFLLARGCRVTASVVSRYGEELLSRYPGIAVHAEPLDEDGMVRFLGRHGASILVDASHPYAANVSQNAMAACRRLGLPYLRYERPATPIAYGKVYPVAGYGEAAERAAALGRNIFLTIGSRNLASFLGSPCLAGCAVTARVLPTASVLAQCEALGLSPKQVVALQGPFSEELNLALFRQYGAEVVVTKDGGQVGGADTKLAAAEALGLPVVLVERPSVPYGQVARSFDEVLAAARQHEARAAD